MIAARLTRRPFICHLREMVRRTTRTSTFLRHADAIVAVSHAAATSYAPLSARRVHVVYNGVPLEQFDQIDPSARARIREATGASASMS